MVLFSGGQDSATCLAWALDRFERVETIGFDYGQRHRIELECRTQVLQSLRERFPAWDAKLGEDRVLDLAVLGEISSSALTSQRAIEFDVNGLPNTFVPGRNLLFLTLAGALAYRRGLSVLVGGMCETDYSGYPDCRDDTLKAQQVTLSLGLDTRVVIETPLMWLDKAATWAMTERLGGDALVELIRLDTHSCYLGDRSRLHAWGYGCGGCPACSLRKAGWERYRPSNARPSHPIQRFALADAMPEPWKNGDGVTRTLATDRCVDTTIAAADSDWNWRISVADIETGGPFSTFEQVDRTLILLHGGPLILNRSGAPITLTDAGQRISFEGEEAVDAQIAATTVQALNLMTRRGQVGSTVRVIHGAPLADPAQDNRASRPPDHHWASLTTLTTAATVAFVVFVVAGSYRIEWSAGYSAQKQFLILRAGEGIVLREASGIGLVSALEIDVDTPSLRSDSAVGSQPWLILITLESSHDSSATIAH